MARDFPDRYILHCLLPLEVQEFHKYIVEKVMMRTGLQDTWKQGLAAHFTLKYWFETPQIDHIEKMLESFTDNFKSQPIHISTPGHFDKNVIFFNVTLSDHAKSAFRGLIESLKHFSWMPWDQYDAENLHFHMTVAENCGNSFEKAWKLVNQEAKEFQCSFDNVTILKMVEVKGSIDLWQTHRTFYLK